MTPSDNCAERFVGSQNLVWKAHSCIAGLCQHQQFLYSSVYTNGQRRLGGAAPAQGGIKVAHPPVCHSQIIPCPACDIAQGVDLLPEGGHKMITEIEQKMWIDGIRGAEGVQHNGGAQQ